MRCDEGKPTCFRCTSTGRNCDGYLLAEPSKDTPAVSVTALAVPDVSADLKLALLPRQDMDEVRSYLYFLDVTAPSLAGSFDADFWINQVPQACYSDAAMWHAIVSLSSMYEDHGIALGGKPQPRNMFALRQYNVAIRLLTQANASFESSSLEHKWRTMTLGAIFTCLCTLEGFYEEAEMHFKYGYGLMNELIHSSVGHVPDNPTTEALHGQQRDTFGTGMSRLPPSPISIKSLQSILEGFKRRQLTHTFGDDWHALTIHSNDNIYNAWNDYAQLPVPIGGPSINQASILTTLTHACQVAQSVLTGLMAFRQRNSKEADSPSAQDSKPNKIPAASRKKDLVYFFNGIEKITSSVQKDYEAQASQRKGLQTKLAQQQIRLLLLSLQLYHTTNEWLLTRLPDFKVMDPHGDGQKKRTPCCSLILDLAEEVFRLQDDFRKAKLKDTQTIPTPPIMIPIFVIALNGLRWADRQRALTLLQQPRLEGFLEHEMIASMATAILEREMDLAQEYGQSLDGSDRLPDDCAATNADLKTRVISSNLVFRGRRESDLEMQTRYERDSEQPVYKVVIYW